MNSINPTVNPRDMVTYRGVQMPRAVAIAQQNQDVSAVMQRLLANSKFKSMLPSQIYGQVFGQRNGNINLPVNGGTVPNVVQSPYDGMTPMQMGNQEYNLNMLGQLPRFGKR